jgi:5-methylcytosine-specific restriction endonuclease McrA
MAFDFRLKKSLNSGLSQWQPPHTRTNARRRNERTREKREELRGACMYQVTDSCTLS